MKCREFIDFVLQYHERKLPADVASRFDRHMQLCPHCVAFLGTYEKTIALAGEAWCDDDELPDSVPEDLISAILDARK